MSQTNLRTEAESVVNANSVCNSESEADKSTLQSEDFEEITGISSQSRVSGSYSFGKGELRRRNTTTLTTRRASISIDTGTPAGLSSASNDQQNAQAEKSSSSTTESGTHGNSSEYECNICFDTASSPVLTLCGHLFCWPCLHQWLEQQSQNPLCPICKAGCGKDKVIPIYGRGKEAKDPRLNSTIPNRPAGQRPEPQRDPNQPGIPFFSGTTFHSATFGPHFSFSATFSIFPTLLGAQFSFPSQHTVNVVGNAPPSPQQAFLSRMLLMFGVLMIAVFFFH